MYISEFQYFPNVNWFIGLIKWRHVVFEQYESYQKMSFRNRTEVAGSNGRISLSIPLLGGREQKRPVREVRIDYRSAWQRAHLRTLESCYNRSAFFEFYRDDLVALYSQSMELLVDWDLACFLWAVRALHLEVDWALTKAYKEEYLYEAVEDVRDQFRPGLGNMKHRWVRTYPQVFMDRQGFLPGLSILDLLFCEGPSARKWLEEPVRS